MKNLLLLTVSLIGFGNAVSADPKNYVGYDWGLVAGDQVISGQELAGLIVGKRLTMGSGSGRVEERYKADGTFEYFRNGKQEGSAVPYKIFPSGLACPGFNPSDSKPYCELFLVNNGKYFEIESDGQGGTPWRTRVKIKD